jgi:hypothetical protein
MAATTHRFRPSNGQESANPRASLMGILADRTHDLRNLLIVSQLLAAGFQFTARPLGDLTTRALHQYLLYRRSRWPNTANTHLIINQQTAHEIGPTSRPWLKKQFAGLATTLEQLRIDRHREEAPVAGGDPLHLTTVFGVSATTAVRYARAAQVLLSSPEVPSSS